MPLTITRTHVVRETKTETLNVPTRWGMFTSKGNKRLTQIAQKAYNKLEALVNSDHGVRGSDVREVLLQYLVAWVKLWDTKTYGEAADTAVRECVGDFHDTLWYAAGVPGDAPWEEHYDEAQMRGMGR